MAHLVHTMAYVGATPWHGLGNRLSPKQPLEVWAREAGMDWTIEETAVRYAAHAEGQPSRIHAFDEQRVLYRSDTQAPLSVVSARYKIVQPREILEFYRDLTELSGFELETAGVLKGGRKVWALARTGQSVTLARRDETRGYVLLATACDGSFATTAQFTSIRVVCNNTLAIALDDSTGAVKVSHQSHFDAQAVKQELGIRVSAWDAFMHRLRRLAKCRVTPDQAQAFLRRVFTDAAHPQPEAAIDRLVAQPWALYAGAGRGATLPSARGTAFGLLNAVTQFIDHERRARTPDNRLDAAWFGTGARLKQKAFDEAMGLALAGGHGN